MRIQPQVAAVVLLLSAGCASPSVEDRGDVMARDTVNFFGQLCLSTLGERSVVEERLARAAHPVSRVPGTTPAAAAWTETSPHGAALRLQVDDLQFCSVDVSAASGRGLHEKAQAMLDRIYGERGFRYRIVGDSTDAETHLRRQEYLLRLPSLQSASVVVSTDAGEGGLSRGRLSFGFSGAEF
jgi:hypothetical protein